MEYLPMIETIGKIIDLLGAVTIIFGIILALSVFIVELIRSDHVTIPYKSLRKHLGRTILVGLELLIAGDIIRSIAVPPSFTTVGVLAVIVLIRVFLSMQIELETEQRWPWQNQKDRNHS